MRGLFHLTGRYMMYHWGKTLVLILSLGILFLLPVAITFLVNHYNRVLMIRAQKTPLIIGAKGDRYDLVLKSLYFSTDYNRSISMADIDYIRDQGWGTVIPLHVRFTARPFANETSPVTAAISAPIVGTELSYFEFRDIDANEGSFPLYLGDAVVGKEFAEKTGVGIGDYLVSNPKTLYDQARTYQLKMPVVGILEKCDSPDDMAVFVDLKTAWVIEGIGHGHEDLTAIQDPAIVDKMRSSDTNVVGTSKVIQYQEITAANRKTFHFHGDREHFPATSCILVPESAKMYTIARGRFTVHETRDALVPEIVIEELMGFVFRIKRFFDANFAVVLASMVCLTALVFTLSYRLRKREFSVLHKIGCSRWTVGVLVAGEILAICMAGGIIALIGALALVRVIPLVITIL
ncbi:MAG: FtsX-like permease family protein [Chitinivibrionales bacterium]|nr:FtsX-like permease family protein [Chitinivibrionales bacterium]